MADEPLFQIQNLHVSTPTTESEPGIEILKGVSLTVREGEVHALVGPDGSGKSTLASALLGSPEYGVTSGRIEFQGDDITDWATDVRGKAGLFLAFQYPQEIAGISVLSFLRQALSARKGIEISVSELRSMLTDWIERLEMDSSFVDRYLNEGFSDTEKRCNEILQMAILEPAMAILDNTDSELEIDALKMMASGVHAVRSNRPKLGTLAITCSEQLLDHLKPDHVHVLIDGCIAASGGPELTNQLQADGFESFA